MPIQFRCQYCRQLLGISRSRAGAAVDCPACGRTLKVPQSDASSTEISPEQATETDAGLLHALEELSQLSTDRGVDVQRSPSHVQTLATESPRQICEDIAEQRADSLRIVPLSGSPIRTSSPVGGSSRHLDIPTDEDSDSRSTRLDDIVADAADAAGETDMVLSSLKWKRYSMWLRSSLLGLLIAVGGFISGYVTALFRTGDFVTPQAKGGLVEQGGQPAKDEDEHLDGTTMRLSGRVLYTDDGGNGHSDSESLVLLMPLKNSSGLRLDAIPLRDPSSTPAKAAVAAALATINCSFTRADSEGQFILDRRTGDAMKLVVISKHRSRPDGDVADSAAAATLAEWFTNPTQLLGRLQIQEKVVPAQVAANDAPVEIVFSGF